MSYFSDINHKKLEVFKYEGNETEYIRLEERFDYHKKNGKDIFFSIGTASYELSCKAAKILGDALVHISQTVTPSQQKSNRTHVVIDSCGGRHEFVNPQSTTFNVE